MLRSQKQTLRLSGHNQKLVLMPYPLRFYLAVASLAHLEHLQKHCQFYLRRSELSNFASISRKALSSVSMLTLAGAGKLLVF